MAKKIFLTAAVATCLTANAVWADEITEQIMSLAQNELSTWLASPNVISAIQEQNAQHAGLTQSDIDGLDQTWRGQADAGEGALIEDLLSRSVSQYLRDRQSESNGLVAEVFIMDNLGLNVAQSDPTSDYWQGDEAKFQETFGQGSGSIHIGEVELDDSSGYYQVQVSLTISDPDDGSAIGAATFGISME